MEFSPEFNQRYEIVRPLGRGGMGEVFLGRIRATGQLVAIKTVQEAALGQAGAKERFLREAKITAALSHPHIIRVQDHGEDRGQLYIAFDFVEGGDVGELLKKSGRLSPDQFWKIALPVLDAVAHAHAAGVLHRDLKGANVFLGGDGVPYVADFGLAKGGDDENLRTATGMIMGTPRYMAPELGLGERASAESDQYALGILCFELLAGRAPFEAPQPLALLRMHVDQPVPRLSSYRPDVPPAVEAAIARALAKPRDGRWLSVAEFRGALAAAQGAPWVDRRDDGDGATVQVPSPPSSAPVTQARRTGQVRRITSKSLTIAAPPPPRRWVAPVAVLALALLAFGGWRVAVARRGDPRFDAVDLRVTRGRSAAQVSWSADLPAARVRLLQDGAVAASAASTSTIQLDGVGGAALNLSLELEDAAGVTHARSLPLCASVSPEGVLAELRRIREVPDSGARDEAEAKLPLEQRYTRRLALAIAGRSGGKPTLAERYLSSPSQIDEARTKSGVDRVLEWYRKENLLGVLEQAAAQMDAATWKQKAELYGLAHRIATLEGFCINSGLEVPPVASRFLAGLGTAALQPGVLEGAGDFSRTDWFTQVVTGHLTQDVNETFRRGVNNQASGAVTLPFKDAVQGLTSRKSNALLEMADAFKSENLMAVEFAPATYASIQGMAVAEPLKLPGLILPPTGGRARPARLRVLVRFKTTNRYSHLDLTWGDAVLLCHRLPPGSLRAPDGQVKTITFLSEIDSDAVAESKATPIFTSHCDPSDVILENPSSVDAYWRTGVDRLALAYRP